jgi:hypothetical protein
MVNFDLFVDCYVGGSEEAIWDGLDFVCVPLVVADAIEEFPPLSLLTVD